LNEHKNQLTLFIILNIVFLHGFCVDFEGYNNTNEAINHFKLFKILDNVIFHFPLLLM
jgi:hypothetical protein